MSLFKMLGCFFLLLLFFFFNNCAFGDLEPLSLLTRWLLVMLPAAWQEFAWHANELCAS